MSTTIDLGKLRFNWVGTWDSTVEYEINDLVKHGGDVFVYIYGVKTTANLTTNATYWALVQEGMSWQGEYDATVAYLPHQVVHHANNSYVCILEEPVAGATEPPNATYWQLLVTGYKFEGLYNDSTTYQVDDIVYYGANTFICIQNTTGTNDPEDTAFWAIFSHGMRWVGIYDAAITYRKDDILTYGINAYVAKHDVAGTLPTDASHFDRLTEGLSWENLFDITTPYQKNDIVKYGTNVYIAKLDTVGNLPTDVTKFDLMSEGLSWENVFNIATEYQKHDVVKYGANTYIAKQDTTGNLPTDVAKWDAMTTGISWQGIYDAAIAYTKDDIVSYGANTYIAKQDTTGNLPTVTTHWDALNSGIASKGDWVASTVYHKDDVVTYGGQSFISLETYTSTTAFATDLAASKWSKFTGGLRWTGIWATSTIYKVNDVVFNGGATYIVSTDHTSTNFAADSANWDSFVNAGTDVSTTITAQGDLIYRDATGPSALNAGEAGQLLSTGGSGANPSWITPASSGIASYLTFS